MARGIFRSWKLKWQHITLKALPEPQQPAAKVLWPEAQVSRITEAEALVVLSSIDNTVAAWNQARPPS